MSPDGEGGTMASYLAMSLDDVLSAFAEAGPAPGGGSAAVIAVALAAALCTMAARLSRTRDARGGGHRRGVRVHPRRPGPAL